MIDVHTEAFYAELILFFQQDFSRKLLSSSYVSTHFKNQVADILIEYCLRYIKQKYRPAHIPAALNHALFIFYRGVVFFIQSYLTGEISLSDREASSALIAFGDNFEMLIKKQLEEAGAI